MTNWQKIPFGIVCLGGGGALTLWSAAAIFVAVSQTRSGLPLPSMLALAVGLVMLGGSLDLLGRGRATGAKRGIIAKSVWADRAQINACKIAEIPGDAEHGDAIYLGNFAEKDGPVRLRYAGTKHLLCFGTPGANKSMGLVVPNLAHLRRSIIVIDPKLQIAAITARKRAALGEVIVLNPFGIFADELPHLQGRGWNPLLQLDPDSLDFESDSMCVADAIIEKSGDGGNSKFFDNSAENFTAAWVMWERFSKGDRPSLADIRAELSAPTIYDAKTKEPKSGFLHTLKQMMACSDHPAIADAGGRLYSRLSDRNSFGTSAQDVIDTVLASTKFLSNPNLKADMAWGGRIDFAALHREITTIYVGLPPHQLVHQAKWLRLFINLALSELYRNAPTGNATLPPVLFMLDEFGNLGRLTQVMSALNLSRDYSIQFFMFLQNLGQLKVSYPKDWTSFFSGAGALTTFQTGDSETQEELSKLFGNREENIQTETLNGVSNTPHAIPLIRAEDISRLGRGDTINLIEPCAMPIKGQAPIYTQTPWSDGLDPNPYYRG
ncbi:type IV secretory system conjugative DNA transfer family protein [Bradyrhizobium sp.]